MHNPFSMPSRWLRSSQKAKILVKLKAQQYDFIGNGYELLSGSIRNHHPETFIEAFKICGYYRRGDKRQIWAYD
jgi:aspartyl-tRNA synthetase